MHLNLKSFISDPLFKITITSKYIHIYNYGKITQINENLISILTNEKKINIYGSSLVINKLDKNELLITGSFIKVDL
ncbi:MAG: YabP/YqfC family sporulation protein [Bacilli bacterium]|nr:YabP/YqfC family sporulation protein [Bacilli bacterium]